MGRSIPVLLAQIVLLLAISTGVPGTECAGTNSSIVGYAATVSGGDSNVANGTYATVGGGYANVALLSAATVAGGNTNAATHVSATVGGGNVNRATQVASTVSGGINNTASSAFATVVGGHSNTAFARYSTVLGGYGNTAGAAGSVALGVGAVADGTKTFVFSGAVNSSQPCYSAGVYTAKFCTTDLYVNDVAVVYELTSLRSMVNELQVRGDANTQRCANVDIMCCVRGLRARMPSSCVHTYIRIPLRLACSAITMTALGGMCGQRAANSQDVLCALARARQDAVNNLTSRLQADESGTALIGVDKAVAVTVGVGVTLMIAIAVVAVVLWLRAKQRHVRSASGGTTRRTLATTENADSSEQLWDNRQ